MTLLEGYRACADGEIILAHLFNDGIADCADASDVRILKPAPKRMEIKEEPDEAAKEIKKKFNDFVRALERTLERAKDGSDGGWGHFSRWQETTFYHT